MRLKARYQPIKAVSLQLPSAKAALVLATVLSASHMSRTVSESSACQPGFLVALPRLMCTSRTLWVFRYVGSVIKFYTLLRRC